ncbi:hypothetical protein FKM82_015465 [Ascaphus truei]
MKKAEHCPASKETDRRASESLQWTIHPRMSFLHLLLLLVVTLICPSVGQTCEIPEADRQHILTKLKAQIVEALGPPPPPSTAHSPAPSLSPLGLIQSEKRTIHKRHSKSNQGSLGSLEDTSQVILFPSSDVPCESPTLDDPQEDPGNSFTYIFRPSLHILSSRVSSAQLWFFTGGSPNHPSTVPENTPSQELYPSSIQTLNDTYPQSQESPARHGHQLSDLPFSVNINNDDDARQPMVDLQVLSEHESVTVATSRVQKVDGWSVFHLAPSFLRYVSRGLFVLLIRCPACPCSPQPEYTPFLTFNTRPTQRARRSGLPWSPAALELLQRPPASGAGNAHCHRGSLNISFEELGWDQWIVQPSSFHFHYCHGTCSPNRGLSPALHWGHCCAPLPTTMKSLWVTTTTDGGFSYRYETVPNLLTQDCACS